MASFNRPRMFNSNQNFNFGFPRGNFEPPNRPPMRRNFERNNFVQLSRYPHSSSDLNSQFSFRPQYPRPVEPISYPPMFRGSRAMENRMPSLPLTRPAFDDRRVSENTSSLFRMRGPPSANERFFVPWNQKPQVFQNKPVRGPKPSTSSDAPSTNTSPKKKRIRKRKLTWKAKEDGRKLKPWMTDEIFAEVKKKNEMYVKAKNNESNKELWQEFRLQRNRVSSMIKEAKLKGGFITKKVKEETDDGVEKPYLCDTCDRAYVQEEDLKGHLKEHVKCGVNGCQFDAHPKVVDIHKKMQHDTGYADTISKLDSAEEIEKWRNERKSRFPTTENIEKRKAMNQEKQARGEVLETENFGKFKKRRYNSSTRGTYKCRPGNRHFRNRRIKTGWNSRRFGAIKPTSVPCNRSVSDSDDDDAHIKISPFPGLMAVTNKAVECLSSEKKPLNPFKCSNTKISNDVIENNCEENFRDSSNNFNNDYSFKFPCLPSNKTCDDENIMDQCIIRELSSNMDSVINSSTVSLCEKESVSSVYSVEKNQRIANVSSKSDEPLQFTNGHKYDDSDDEGPSIEPIQKISSDKIISSCKNDFKGEDMSVDPILKILEDSLLANTKSSNSEINLCHLNDSDDEGPTVEPICKVPQNAVICSVENGTDTASKNLNHKQGERGKNKEPCMKPKLPEENTHIPHGLRRKNLLDKLLANEIRHERNVILQCVYHIVKNNFFGVGTD